MTTERKPRLAVIDGLRLLVALAVAAYHYLGTLAAQQVWAAPPESLFHGVHDAASYGWLGVEMFFLISGFVICMSSWGRTGGAFFRSRVTRLFPAYWPAVLLTTTVLLVVPDPFGAPKWHQVLVNLTMLNGPLNVAPVDNVYWTLWAEARFYLLFAVALLWRGGITFRRAAIFGYAWLAAAAVAGWTGDRLLGSLLQPDFAPYFVCGMALYLIYRFGSRRASWGLVAVAYPLMMLSVRTRTLAVRSPADGQLRPLISMVIITVFCAILTVVALGWTSRIQWRWLTTAGALTYPFYLTHLSIGWVLLYALRNVHPHLLVAALVAGVMLFTAWLLHRLVELPLARVLKNALARTQPRPPLIAEQRRAPAEVLR